MNKEEMLTEEIVRLKEELQRVREYDELTGLYNRHTYYDRVRKRLDKNPDKKYVIVAFDIEKFKFINDRFGFIEGDRLLAHIGNRLHERAEKYGLVAGRLSSDIFSFLDYEENIVPKSLGAEIQGWVTNYPLDTDIKLAVGIYHVETRGLLVRLMCDKANLAKDTVKNNYILNVAEYNKDVSEYLYAQNELLNESERAFKDFEFKVYLQPKFDIRTNKIIGAESLVRWQHPKRGLIYPKDFIPLFEKNMLIARLDAYVWEQTCRIIRDWMDKGYTAVPVSVNVSRMDMLVLDVSGIFKELTDKYNIDRRLVEIEITESAFTDDENQMINLVDELRSLGFRVLMDDFGSGYSSLNILKDINVDVLKIDTRFLEPGRDGNEKGREILESVIRMAKWIGLQTVAEGVETDAQKHFLMDLGCYYAQGFYFSRPISEEEFEKLIKNPDNVDGDARMGDDGNNTIAIEELFHSDFMTENLLNNILGGVAIYEFDGGNELKLIKANDSYCDITKNYIVDGSTEGINVIGSVHPDDREKALEGLRKAKKAGYDGCTVQIRNIYNNAVRLLTVKIFYLAERDGKGIYYTSVSDSTEQMKMALDLNKSKVSFETALDLIEAVVLEYNFAARRLEVKTNLKRDSVYIVGEAIENVPESLVEKKLVHPDYEKAWNNLCEHIMTNKEPISCTLGLLYVDNVYRLCSVAAKTIYEAGVPAGAIIVVKSTGRNIE